MPPPKESTMKADDALIEQLCLVTSVSRVVATNLLEACNNNLEMAVNMHMEGVVTDANGAAASAVVEDEVRAPIPQRQEVLVEGPDQLAFSFSRRSRVTRSVFDKFRDFEVEARRQEEELLEGVSTSSTSSATTNTSWKRKMKTLEDLFRPPLDLMFRGSFQSAREAGIGAKKWLMVNVQNSSEFPCQVLNRDVWSNSAVKTIIQEYFIFWQIYHDSEDGQRYMTFYPVSDWPYIAVIDPRTGERLVHWNKMDAVSFCELITEFLADHPSLDDSSDNHEEEQSQPVSPIKKRLKVGSESILEADESAQLEAAIKASLETRVGSSTEEGVQVGGASSSTNGRADDDDDTDTLETFHDTDSEDDISIIVSDRRPKEPLVTPSSVEDKPPETTPSKEEAVVNGDEEEEEEEKEESESAEGTTEGGHVERWRSFLGSENDAISKLMLRFPDGSRESLNMPSTSKLMALVLYISSKGFSNEQYELVTNFPKRRLSILDFHISLKSAGLYPQETVFIQKR